MSDLYQVEAPSFVAGILVNHKGVVVKTAPILKRFLLWNLWKVRRDCEARRWRLTRLESGTPSGLERPLVGIVGEVIDQGSLVAVQ